jgi:hypothetical protein
MPDYRMTVIALFNSRFQARLSEKGFASAVLCIHLERNLVDLVVKNGGLWWGCGAITTRSYSNRVNSLSLTLWPCGKYKVGLVFESD